MGIEPPAEVSPNNGSIMLDVDLLMDLDLRKVFPKLFQGYPILKWRVIKEEFFFFLWVVLFG